MIIDEDFLDNDKKGYSCYSASKGGRAVQGKKMKTDGVKTKHHLDQIRSDQIHGLSDPRVKY